MTTTQQQCATCKHIKRGPMTRGGFNLCALAPIWESFPLSHRCAQYMQAPQVDLDKRAAWLASVAAARQPALVARG